MRRRGFATGAACLLLTGCAGGDTEAPAKPTADSPSQRQVRPGPDSLRCDGYIDATPDPPSDFEVVLGVVALPTSSSHGALQTTRTGKGRGPTRLFGKRGLIVRSGTSFELVVPAGMTDRLRIGWGGSPSTPHRRVVVSDCAGSGDDWLGYPGGYWVDRPACVPLIVRTADEEQRVRIGVGAPCPGQQPPPEPTER